MPIPSPRKKEKEQNFIGRCMGDPIMLKEYKDSSQRYAICKQQWDDRNNSEESMCDKLKDEE